MIPRKSRRSPGVMAVLGCGLVLLFWVGISWAAEAGAHEGPSKWPDFFYRLLNFAILVGVLYFVLRKPLRQFFAKRSEGIANTLSELETKKKEAEKTYEEYNQKLAQLDSERERILKEYTEQGEAEKAKIIANAEKAANEIRKQAELAIQQEVNAAKAALQREIVDLSVSAAETLLKEKIATEDHKKLVDDFMNKVVEAK